MAALISLADPMTAWVSGLVGDVRTAATWLWVIPANAGGAKLLPLRTQRLPTSSSAKLVGLLE